MTNRKAYPTDLSELEWQILAPLLLGQKPRGRKLVYSRREILNAIFYVVRAGCTWRLLPHDLAPYRIVFHYYRTWQKDCTWTAINDLLRGQVRLAEGRNLSLRWGKNSRHLLDLDRVLLFQDKCKESALCREELLPENLN